MNRNIEIQQIKTMAALAAAGNTKIQKMQQCGISQCTQKQFVVGKFLHDKNAPKTFSQHGIHNTWATLFQKGRTKFQKIAMHMRHNTKLRKFVFE